MKMIIKTLTAFGFGGFSHRMSARMKDRAKRLKPVATRFSTSYLSAAQAMANTALQNQ